MLDLELATDFVAMPGTAARPSHSWDDLARRPDANCWWGHLVFRLDEAIDAGFAVERITAPLIRILAYVRARCAARAA